MEKLDLLQFEECSQQGSCAEVIVGYLARNETESATKMLLLLLGSGFQHDAILTARAGAVILEASCG